MLQTWILALRSPFGCTPTGGGCRRWGAGLSGFGDQGQEARIIALGGYTSKRNLVDPETRNRTNTVGRRAVPLVHTVEGPLRVGHSV